MSRDSSLFSSEWKAWTAVAVYAGLLYGTLTVAFDLYVFVYDRVGRETVSFWMNFAVGTTGVLVVGWLLFHYRPPLSGYVALGLIGLVVAYCLSQLPVPAKRFHFLQYGPLTALVYAALGFRSRNPDRYVWAMLLVALIGLGDETIQALLPDRHFGLLDLVINSTAAAVTLAFIGFVARRKPAATAKTQVSPVTIDTESFKG
jgi:hypothetical protein